MINIDELTIGQMKEIQAMCALTAPTKSGAKPATKPGSERPVIVCTDKRGVFFGYCTDTTGDVIVMTRARMCVYWDVSTKGVLGLSATGPTGGCRITAAVPAIELRGITCVIECTPEATEAWEVAPWIK